MDNRPCFCLSGTPIWFCVCSTPILFFCNNCQRDHLNYPSKSRAHYFFECSLLPMFHRMGRDALIQRESLLRTAREAVEAHRRTEREAHDRAVMLVAGLNLAVEGVHRAALTILDDVEKSIAEAHKADIRLPPLCGFIVNQPQHLKSTAFRIIFDLKQAIENTKSLNTFAGSLESSLLQQIHKEMCIAADASKRSVATSRNSRANIRLPEIVVPQIPQGIRTQEAWFNPVPVGGESGKLPLERVVNKKMDRKNVFRGRPQRKCSHARIQDSKSPPQHFQDVEKEEFHDEYPYEMIEIYERLGRDGLARRKTQLTAAKSILQSYRNLETEEFTSALSSLTEARHALELIHRSFQELFSSTTETVFKALKADIVLDLDGFSDLVVKQGNRKLGTEAFGQMYCVQAAQVLSKGYLRLSTENLEDQLIDLLSLERKTDPISTRLKKSATHKLLTRDSNASKSGYLTPRRSCKPKMSPYHPIVTGKVTSSKRKNSANRETDSQAKFLNSTSQFLYDKNAIDETLFRSDQEPLLESYHSPSVLARASGKNSRIGKPADDIAASFERSFVKKKHPSEAGIRRDNEGGGAEFAEYVDGIQGVIKKTIKLQKRLGKTHY